MNLPVLTSAKLLYLIVFCLFFISPKVVFSQPQLIEGTVTNQTGEPLVGASVMAKNSVIGTVTNEKGFYSLAVPEKYQYLVFQYLGFVVKEEKIDNRTTIHVQLIKQTTDLDEVVVVGFGDQNKKMLTSAISKVGEEAFAKVSVPVFQRALQGQLPGVVLTNASGGLNAESIIRIRGVGSISASNQPLFVVDGLILAAQPDASLGYTTNPLIGLNPNDIASVQVLKDAAATAIYGARGSNGVILITTKSGSYNQSPKVNVAYYAGFSQISKKHDLLNGQEYASLWNEAARNAGYDPTTNPEMFYDVTAQPSTDWQELLLQKGFVQEASANVSGGSPTTKYYIGGSFRGEDGYLRRTGMQRYAFRANLEQLIGDKVRVGLSVNPSRVIDNRTGNQWAGSAWGATAWFQPNVEGLDENGDCRRDPILGFSGNPCVVLEDQWIEGITTHLLANTHLSWSPITTLQFKTQFGLESYQVQQSMRLGEATWFGAPSGFASFANKQVFNYNWTNLAIWQPNLNRYHNLKLTGGLQLTRDVYQGQSAGTANFPDDRIRSVGAGAIPDGPNSFQTEAAFVGYLARAAYGFQNKYLLEASARYDGSSRFGPNNRYGFFPALSAGWILSEEDFLKSKKLNFLKWRASIGLTGNAGIGNDPYRGLVDFSANYAEEPGYIIQSIENNNLGWEKSLQWDVGLDFGLWENRLRGSLDYYIRDTKDLLLEQPVPSTNGVSTLFRNVGKVRNQGFEFELTADILKGDLDWSFQINGATLKNEVRQLVDQDGDGLEDDIVLNNRIIFRPGASIGSFYLVEYAGVDRDNGDALYYDLEGNLEREALSGNRKIVGHSLPAFTGGFTNVFQFKNFDLSAFFHFKTGYHIYWESNLESNLSSGSSNQRRSQLNAWRPNNRDTDVPQARLNSQNGTRHSTRYLHRGDFLRLQHLQLGYTFQKLGGRKSNLRIFATTQNLVTFTKFPGLDPDSEFYASESAAQGAVRYNLPAARTFTVGCNLQLL